jgi:hypothetical protein
MIGRRECSMTPSSLRYQKNFEVELNALDRQVTEMMLSAEKHVCPRQHENWWSLEIHYQSVICNYWITREKGHRNHIDNSNQAFERLRALPEGKRQEVKHKIAELCPPTLLASQLAKVIRDNKRKSIKKKKEMVKQAFELRQQTLASLKTDRLSEGDAESAARISSIASKERQKNDWQ